jgi:hypothetical protein
MLLELSGDRNGSVFVAAICLSMTLSRYFGGVIVTPANTPALKFVRCPPAPPIGDVNTPHCVLKFCCSAEILGCGVTRFLGVCACYPGVFEEFSSRDTEVGVFLETLQEEVADGRGGAVGERGVFVVDDAE